MYHFKHASAADTDVIRHIFQESILSIPSHYYTASQLLQWAAVFNNTAYWQQLLETQTCILCLQNTTPIGYISLAKNGFIDHLYVTALFQRKGLGTALIQQVEAYAKTKSIQLLETDASLIATPLFKKMGYQLVREYEKHFNGEVYTNSILKKQIT
jgi:putative acetyltransferase